MATQGSVKQLPVDQPEGTEDEDGQSKAAMRQETKKHALVDEERAEKDVEDKQTESRKTRRAGR
jgi:hypothetical protein